jgi:hypothetical protein
MNFDDTYDDLRDHIAEELIAVVQDNRKLHDACEHAIRILALIAAGADEPCAIAKSALEKIEERRQ